MEKKLHLAHALVALSLALETLPQAAAADPLDTWTWRNPLPTGANLSCITYGNGQFVAVGWDGTTLTSVDGTNWVQFSEPILLSAVVYANGHFLAVGSGYGSLTGDVAVSSID